MLSLNTQADVSSQDAESTTSTVNTKPKLPQKPSPCPESKDTAYLFRKLWPRATDDNRLTLFGFQRFRTSHLLNLRFLEDEIHKLDHQIYQAGLNLELPLTKDDRLGLRHGKRDANAQGMEKSISQGLILRLRELIKQYGMLCSLRNIHVC